MLNCKLQYSENYVVDVLLDGAWFIFYIVAIIL